jgi:hypothetical protein
MTAIRRFASICLLCAAVAACGGSGGSSASSDRQQITNLFDQIYAAITHGDFTTACGYLSQRQQRTVVAGARRGGLNASTCPDAFTALLKATGVTRARLAQAFGAAGIKRKLDSISIHGDHATVTFTETEAGNKTTYDETDAVVRENGKWRADRILKRSQTG